MSGDAQFSTSAGLIAVVVCVIAWGTFAVPFKDKSVQKVKLNAILMQCYMNIGIFMFSGWSMILASQTYEFTWWAILGAAIWLPGNLLALVAIKYLGIAVAQPVWAGGISVISFLWGVVAFREIPKNWVAAIFGLIGLVISISLIASCNEGEEQTPNDEKLLGDDPERQSVSKPPSASSSRSKSDLIRGLLACMGVAIAAGSTNTPIKYAQEYTPNAAGPQYGATFALGIVMFTPLMFIGYSVHHYSKEKRLPNYHLRETLLPCIIAGALWSIGNIGSVIATLSTLGLAVGYPLTQSALLVAGLWGIFLYREIRSRRKIMLFFFGAFLLVGSASILSAFGPS